MRGSFVVAGRPATNLQKGESNPNTADTDNEIMRRLILKIAKHRSIRVSK